ncbi:MAG: hypothetical protein K6U10_03430 [Acidobacteriia bacterium]|nr:hypothetical protein [Methyloceanibacter sp.]MCL6490856.1 hypothetical protein [Terriglobia bacterium]
MEKEERWPRPAKLDPAAERRRRGRNIAMLIVLLGLSALFYAMAMVKMHQHL